ncbi:T9SS type B sorting domain-containing protein [Neolewinella aurantiaca]|nr:gliding motility-associated C-terminal domain-containing protein [Neolewinella aurantiaca]
MYRFLLFCLFLSSGGSAQDFHRYYDFGGAESLSDLIVLSPERLVAVGNSRDSSGTDHAILLTLNGQGEVIGSITPDYNLRTRGMTLARQTDSTFWVGCWRTPFEIVDDWVVYLVNANTSEATGFGWGVETVDEQIRTMAPYPDGGVVVAGNTGIINEAIISRLDAQGNEVFRRAFSIPGNQFSIFTDVEIGPNGNIFAAGDFHLTGGPTGKNGYFVAEFTPAGSLIRSQRYDFPEGEDGADEAGVALELLPQGFLAIVGSRRVEGGRVGVTIIIDQNLEVAGAFQRINSQYSTARDLLAIGQDRLLIVGSGLDNESVDFGLVTDFDVAGTGTPLNVAFGTRNANNYFNGLAARPGGGFYFYGRGNLCPGEDGSDALLISVGPGLNDPVANCYSLTDNVAGREIFPTSTAAGIAFDRQDERFDPPVFRPVPVTATQDQTCPRIASFPAAIPDPACYETPILLLDSAVLVSPPGSVSRILVSIGGANAGAMDFLEVDDLPAGIVANGNRSRNLTLMLEEPGGSSELLLATLSRIRFGIEGDEVAGGERIIGVNVAGKCERGDFFSFNFSLAPYLPAPFGLPADTTLCPETALVLEGPDIAGLTYRWSNGDTTRTTLADEPGEYTLRVTTGCREDSATVRVTAAADAPQLTAAIVQESVCLGDSLVFQPGSEPGVRYAWADGTPDTPDRVFRTGGTYELLRANACSDASTTVEVSFRDCCRLYLPNAFSPNGDGINDVFRAFPDTDECNLVSDFSLQVFDRWGGEVYVGQDITEGWDGTVNGKMAGNGHYVYGISYFNGLMQITRSGGVVLLR